MRPPPLNILGQKTLFLLSSQVLFGRNYYVEKDIYGLFVTGYYTAIGFAVFASVFGRPDVGLKTVIGTLLVSVLFALITVERAARDKGGNQ